MTCVGWEFTVYPRDTRSPLVAAGVMSTQELSCWVAGEVLLKNDHAYYAIVQLIAYQINSGEPDPRTRVGLVPRLKGKRTREGEIKWTEDLEVSSGERVVYDTRTLGR